MIKSQQELKDRVKLGERLSLYEIKRTSPGIEIIYLHRTEEKPGGENQKIKLFLPLGQIGKDNVEDITRAINRLPNAEFVFEQ